MVLVKLGALHHFAEGVNEFEQGHVRRRARDLGMPALDHHQMHLAPDAWQPVDGFGRLTITFVFLQPAHQLGARIGLLASSSSGRGNSMRDPISASIAAISKYSASSSSRSSACSSM